MCFIWQCLHEVLLQSTTHLIQRPCYQRGSPCQDPAGNWTARRPPDHHKEMQTAVIWSCLPFIRSGQNHLARHIERGKKTRQTEEEMGRQHQEMDRPGVRQVPKGSGEQGKNGGNWLWNHLWCPNDPYGKRIDDDDDVHTLKKKGQERCCLSRNLEPTAFSKHSILRTVSVKSQKINLPVWVNFWRTRHKTWHWRSTGG